MKKQFDSIEELHTYINDHVPGAFSIHDMKVLVPEVQKLEPGQTYVEIGVDSGRSFATAYYSTKTGVETFGVDNRNTHEREHVWGELSFPSYSFIHGASADIAKIWGVFPIHVLFIDGDHSYDGVKTDIDSWFPFMSSYGVMLFHDYDESSPGVIRAVSEFVQQTGRKLIVPRNENPELATSIVKVEI